MFDPEQRKANATAQRKLGRLRIIKPSTTKRRREERATTHQRHIDDRIRLQQHRSGMAMVGVLGTPYLSLLPSRFRGRTFLRLLYLSCLIQKFEEAATMSQLGFAIYCSGCVFCPLGVAVYGTDDPQVFVYMCSSSCDFHLK